MLNILFAFERFFLCSKDFFCAWKIFFVLERFFLCSKHFFCAGKIFFALERFFLCLKHFFCARKIFFVLETFFLWKLTFFLRSKDFFCARKIFFVLETFLHFSATVVKTCTSCIKILWQHIKEGSLVKTCMLLLFSALKCGRRWGKNIKPFPLFSLKSYSK